MPRLSLTSILVALIALPLSLAGAQSAVTEIRPQAPEPPKDTVPREASAPVIDLQRVEVVGRRDKGYKSDYSFSATKVQMNNKDIPQSISTITKELIQEQGATRVSQVLKNVAGANSFSTYDDVVLRGFRDYHGALTNGLKAPSNWYTPSLYNVERVEVVKGPASALFSNVVPGGIINYVTKKPLTTQRREVSVSTGSWNNYNLAADLTGPLNDSKTALYRLNLGYENTESFRAQRFDKTYFVSPTLTFRPDEATSLNLEAVWSRNMSSLDRGAPSTRDAKTPDLPISLSLSQPGDFLNENRLNLTLSASRRFGDLSLNAVYMGSRLDAELQEHGLSGYITDDSVSLYFDDRLEGGQTHALTLYGDYSLSTGPVKHGLLAGFDYNRQEDYTTQVESDSVGAFSLRRPVYTRRPFWNYSLTEIPLGTYDAYSSTFGAYLQDLLEWRRFKLLISLRQELYVQHSYNSANETVVTPAFIPRVGLTYSLTDRINVYGTYATGFQPADTYLQTTQSGGPFETPETSNMIEAGFKSDWFGRKLLFTAAAYQILKNDVIVYANDTVNPDLNRQVGQIRSRGIEVEAVGKLTPAWDVNWNYAFNDAEITEDAITENEGKPFENAPRHSSGLWTHYRLPIGLGAGLGYEYLGERHTFEEGFMLPDYGIWSASLDYRIKAYAIGFRVNNILDEDYYSGGYAPDRTFPGAPRNWLAQVSCGF